MNEPMKRSSRIYVAGHRGLVGSAIIRCLRTGGYQHVLMRPHAELDLTDQVAVRDFFDRERPEYVFVAAAKVGGILANDTFPADFIYQNLVIQTNVIHEAWRSQVKRLLFLGSSCIYPRDCAQPIKEEYLLTGPLETTNRPYAVAKIAGIEMCWSYNRQYGSQFLAVMPTNLYGIGDNYDLETSHVIPAMIRKMHEAKTHDEREVVLWGTGKPRREFLYSDDLASACSFLMTLTDEEFLSLVSRQDVPPLLNIGCGEDVTVLELATLVNRVVGYDGKIVWDTAKPDGTPRKLLDGTRIRSLGWNSSVTLLDGLQTTYRDYVSNLLIDERQRDGARIR